MTDSSSQDRLLALVDAVEAEAGLSKRRLVEERRACAYILAANLPHLAEFYGRNFASIAGLELQRRLCANFTVRPSSDLARLHDDCFLLWANIAFDCLNVDVFGSSQPSPRVSSEIEMLLVVLGAEPVRVGGTAALVQPHVDWIDVCGPKQLSNSEIEFALWAAQPFTACAHFAQHVVVDGTEHDDDISIASREGAQWLQGYRLHDAECRARADVRARDSFRESVEMNSQ